MVCSISGSSGPSTHTAKSARGGLWRGVFMSSMTLMPPTKAIAPVDLAELAVQATQTVRAELPRRDLGAILQEVDAAVAHVALERGRQIELRAPTVDEHAHVHASLRRAESATATRRPVASSAKM